MASEDPLVALDHDHVELSKLVSELGGLVARARAGEPAAVQEDVVALLEGLRDDLFLHFAQEEEGLFPYLLARLPDEQPHVAAIEAAHDAICGALGRMVHLAERGLGEHAEALASLFERFEANYAAHARDERGFLRRVGERLGDAERAEVAELVKGL
jgi:hemerythrin